MADTETWRQRVASWRASGQTAAEFSASYGGAAATLRWWASRLKRETRGTRGARAPRTPDAPQVQLARLVRRTAPPAPQQHGDVVVDFLDLGVRVTAAGGAPRELLQGVLAALGVGGAR